MGVLSVDHHVVLSTEDPVHGVDIYTYNGYYTGIEPLSVAYIINIIQQLNQGKNEFSTSYSAVFDRTDAVCNQLLTHVISPYIYTQKTHIFTGYLLRRVIIL